MFRSLRLKLAVSHAAVLAVILFILGVTGHFLLARRLDSGATQELRDASRAEVEQLGENAPLQTPVDPDLPSQAGVKLALYYPSGQIVGDPSEAPSWLRPQTSPIKDIIVSGETVRIATVPVLRGGVRVATVVAGRSLQPEEALLHHVRVLMLAGSVVAIIFSLLAGWWLAGLAVRPVIVAYEAQANFAADASHELRTPLAFVRSGVEVLSEEDPELGGAVLDEIDYLTSLTDRLLMLARIEREGLGFERSVFPLARACMDAVRRSRIAHGNSIEVHDGGFVDALGDRAALEAALDAVLENVHTHGGGAAEVSWSRDGTRAVIAIADHGPGLPAGVALDGPFERFYRADPSRTRDTGGAGLGLSLARTLVRAQGGEIWLERSSGGGLTVKISLAVASASEQRAASGAELPSRGTPRPRGSTRR